MRILILLKMICKKERRWDLKEDMVGGNLFHSDGACSERKTSVLSCSERKTSVTVRFQSYLRTL